MRSLFRWICGAMLIGALASFVLAGWLWHRSQSIDDAVSYLRTDAAPPRIIQAVVGAERGKVLAGFSRSRFSTPLGSHLVDHREWQFIHTPGGSGRTLPPSAHQMLGFGFELSGESQSQFLSVGIATVELGVWFPMWAVMAACGAIAVFSILKLRRRPLPGHCRRCGYDLRATHDRCPECGTVITPTTLQNQTPM
jgi:hypothetical protein